VCGYEGLLEKNAAAVKGGAERESTMIQAIVDLTRPAPGQTIHHPACGTGGSLLIAHDFVSQYFEFDRDQKEHLKLKALSGNKLVDGVARLCVMNLYPLPRGHLALFFWISRECQRSPSHAPGGAHRACPVALSNHLCRAVLSFLNMVEPKGS